MNLLIHFDVASVIILMIILATNLYRKMYKDMSSVVFMGLIATTLLAATFECAQIILYGAGVRNDIVFTVIKTLYVLFHNLATPVYFLYVISIARTWHKMQEHPVIPIALLVPYAVILIMYIINPFTGWMFTFSGGIETLHTAAVQYICSGITGCSCILCHVLAILMT